MLQYFQITPHMEYAISLRRIGLTSKLFPNIKRITTAFSIGILCVTISVLTLRLTVFSDMVTASKEIPGMISSEDYRLNGKIQFASASSKGNVFITNLSEDRLIKVEVFLTDTGETILSTGFLMPGSTQNSSKMNPTGQKLKDGEYPCTAQITAYQSDNDRALIGSDEMDITVFIGEVAAEN